MGVIDLWSYLTGTARQIFKSFQGSGNLDAVYIRYKAKRDVINQKRGTMNHEE